MAAFLTNPRNRGVILTGLGLYGATVYASFHAYKLYSAPPPPEGIADPHNQPCFNGVYNGLAPEYDARIGWDEWLMGLGRRRRNLVERAKGEVLETSAGTGRNLSYYPLHAVRRLTLSDSSEPMLHAAALKTRRPNTTIPLPNLPPIRFAVLDATNLAGIPDNAYDTVVDTFGLCSVSDPVAALREMGRVCARDGRVLLLQHGRGRWDWLNRALDLSAEDHAKTWGCWWNRDVEGIVKEAGLEVVEMRRHHFGTTFEIVARPVKVDAVGSAASA
ncbi:S-adenosyl-L-methionine-dependent methyltransferase [Blyttiomyces helicus]|uniref:S-adenosyl-L-methionine-dependent methyltransferase n=1 Tax=Blyttiomyces helicus TaxID=388810 RepID=A0A4P9W9U3_9FUNG|nr:S-adenosyl-L-methionine-dependent methyltransferase [Blyttiomyces helicus]|eukprot:RKO89184.1 S-adenosyl-L-methionine-dependent methyltransferase [Blyttiomyces helicus]